MRLSSCFCGCRGCVESCRSVFFFIQELARHRRRTEGGWHSRIAVVCRTRRGTKGRHCRRRRSGRGKEQPWLLMLLLLLLGVTKRRVLLLQMGRREWPVAPRGLLLSVHAAHERRRRRCTSPQRRDRRRLLTASVMLVRCVATRGAVQAGIAAAGASCGVVRGA